MNIFNLRKLGVAVLAVLLLGFVAPGFAQKVTHYTADQVTMGVDGKSIGQINPQFTVRIYSVGEEGQRCV